MVLVPGLVAVAPWLLALVQYTRATLGFDFNSPLAFALIFSLVTVVGSIIEGIDTFIEVRWDKQRETQYSVDENWYCYLSQKLDHEPVGFRYLSRLATTLYFELSMLCAAPPFIAGAGLLCVLRFYEFRCAIIVAIVVMLIAAVASFGGKRPAPTRCFVKLG